MNRILSCMAMLALAPFSAVSQQLPFGDVPPGVIKPSFGCEAAVHDEASRKSCALDELRYVDGRLNARYQELRRELRPTEIQSLVATQRGWLKARDASCNLDRRTPERQAWLDYAADSAERAACVRQLTEKRLMELERMQNEVAAAPVLAAISPPPAESALVSGEAAAEADIAPDHLIRSAQSHRSGKLYFEAVIEPARAEKLEASLIVRVNDGRRWTGTTHDIRPRDIVLRLGPGSSVTIAGGSLGDIRVPKVVVGIAVDLDSGRLYRHRDGNWLGGVVPGSPQGIELRRDAAYTAEVRSSVQLAQLLERGIVKVNFGATPFDRQPPAGYRGFDWQDNVVEVAAKTTARSVYSPRDRIAGDSQARWVQRYWEWVRSFAPAESPSADPSGYRCGAGQSGPVWFLTGSKATTPVQRECEVPEGKILLVPIVNVLAQANPAAQVACDSLLISLRQFSSGVADLRFKLNGVALESPQRFLLGTGCFRLRDASSGQTGIAVGSGYWIFVKPVKKGRHEVEFGGTFSADGFQQDIRYVLHVR